MRCDEILGPTKRVLDIKPEAVKRQARVNQVLNQIAASDQRKPAELSTATSESNLE